MLNFLVSFLFLVSTSAGAATPQDWNTLLKKTYAQNQDLQSLKRVSEAVSYQKAAARSDYFPSVFLFADRLREEQTASFLESDTTTDTYGVKASWNLFNGFLTYNSVRKYAYQERQSAAQLVLKMAELRFALRGAVNRILTSQRAVKTWTKLLQWQQDQLTIVEIKYKNGTEALWSVEVSRANVEITKATLELEKTNYAAARADIDALLGEALPQDFELRDDLDQSLKTAGSVTLSEDHPQLVLLQQQVDEAWSDSAIQKSEYLPTLRANVQWAKAKTDDRETIQDNQVGLTVSLPLFEGFSTVNQVSQANSLALSREFTLKDSRLRLEKDIANAQILFTSNLKFLKAKELEVKATKMWSQTVEKQYRLGVRRYSDWEQAQTTMISSERDYLQSLKDTLDSRINLERLLAVTEEM